MGNNRFYTPDGFTDTVPGICAFKKQSEAKLRRLFELNGYNEIETTGIEYCDIYTSTSFVSEESLYKMQDSKGRLLCARYDGTVPAARFAATIMREEKTPIRLCYIENMYRYSQIGGGKQSEFTQAGVELLGETGSNSDAEVIALAIRSALELGVKDLQVSVGQVELFNGIVRQFNMEESIVQDLKDAIAAKDSVSIDRVAGKLGLSKDEHQTLSLLSESTGTYEVVDLFENRVTDEGASKALKNLREILNILDDYGFLKYVNIDLGLFGSVDYYTGMIFKGFTYEVGFPIISGGRYDKVVNVFGRDLEAVGFSLGLSLAITSLMRQGKKCITGVADAIVGYDNKVEGARSAAIALAEKLRASGSIVILDTAEMNESQLDEYADSRRIGASFYINESNADMGGNN